MARKQKWYRHGLVSISLGMIVGGAGWLGYTAYEAHERAEREKPLDFGQVNPTPEPTVSPVMPRYYMPTQTLHRQTVQPKPKPTASPDLKPGDYTEHGPWPTPSPTATPTLTQTSVSHDPPGPITTESDDPIPSGKLTSVITLPKEGGLVVAHVYNGTNLARDVWLIAWEDRSVTRHNPLDNRHALVNPRETVKLFMDKDRRVTRYEMVAALPGVAFLLDKPVHHEFLAEKLVVR